MDFANLLNYHLHDSYDSNPTYLLSCPQTTLEEEFR